MRKIYENIMEAVNRGQAAALYTKFESNKGKMGIDLKLQLEISEPDEFKEIDEENKYQELFVSEARLIICGGGHISMALSEFAAKTGFEPVIIDDREDFANEKRFPSATQVLCGDYQIILQQLQITNRDYVVIVTRGHARDGECLLEVIHGQMPYYVGMIGSKSRVSRQFEMFIEQGEDKASLDQVHTPIGLSIKAQTPQEIAIAILAELIQYKRKEEVKKWNKDFSIPVLKMLAKDDNSGALVTIMDAEGSTPIGKGAKMLVTEQGVVAGTIGGGRVEIDAIKKAKSIIGTGNYEYYSFYMDADVAKDEGMACGGNVDVLIEDLVVL